jgi:hypothetical protein
MRPPVIKLLFRLKHPLLLQLSIELVASLNVRPVFASNELLSVLASLCQTPDAVFAQGRFGKPRGTNPNCIVEFPQTHINARFISQINRIIRQGKTTILSTI